MAFSWISSKIPKIPAEFSSVSPFLIKIVFSIISPTHSHTRTHRWGERERERGHFPTFYSNRRNFCSITKRNQATGRKTMRRERPQQLCPTTSKWNSNVVCFKANNLWFHLLLSWRVEIARGCSVGFLWSATWPWLVLVLLQGSPSIWIGYLMYFERERKREGLSYKCRQNSSKYFLCASNFLQKTDIVPLEQNDVLLETSEVRSRLVVIK